MTISTKEKISNFIYIILGLSPLVYVISFITFLYYTGNGFGNELDYNPQPEKKRIYLSWLDLIHQLDDLWILSFFLWIALLIVTAIFLRRLRTKGYIIATCIIFIMAIYLGFFSVYGGHEGWISEYYDAVLKINRR